jgi:hypothetical protein
MERLKAMKERLMSCVESQMGDLSKTNAEELGEVVDMIKDLEETIYYCTVVEAMEDKEKEPTRSMMYYPVMYYNNGGDMSSGSMGNNARGNGRGYSDGRYYYPEPYYYGDAYSRGMRDYGNVYPRELRDYREGRSGNSRRMYMESKEMHEGKEKQMMELEKYIKELSGDMMEMINDATPEEKEILSQKLSTLAEKIK